MPPDISFEALLAAHNQEYADAEVFSQWQPPPGEYVVIVEKLDTGVTAQEEAEDMMWWSLRCMIVDEGSLFQKKFSIFSSSKALGIFKGLVEALNGGEPVEGGLVEAHAVMEGAVGSALRIESTSSFSKKDKRDYINIAILEVLQTETADDPLVEEANDGTAVEDELANPTASVEGTGSQE